MKAIVVCVAEWGRNIIEITNPDISCDIVYRSKQALSCIEFESKTEANRFTADNLLKENLLIENKRDLIRRGKLNEFNIKGVNVSIRIGNEMECFLNYFNDAKQG